MVTLERSRIGDAAHLREPILPFGAAMTFEQRHFIAVLFVHYFIDEQQTGSEIGIQQVPVAARVFQRGPDLFDFARGERFGRQRQRRYQLLAFQQRRDFLVGHARGVVVLEHVPAPQCDGH